MLPESDEYDTVAGLLLDHLEDIPKKDDLVDRKFYFTIRDVNKTKIQEVELIIDSLD